MSDITLSKAVRSNLLNLQSTAGLLSKSQERLSTGLRVNSALDNPTNFFTAQGLNSRANDLSQLLDSVSNAVQTVAAADKGITAITKLVESAQATARQALQTSATLAATSLVTASVTSGNTTSTTITASSAANAGTLTAGTFSSVNLAAASSAQAGSITGGAFTAMDFTVASATAGTNTLTFGSDLTFDADDALTFDISVDGGAAQTVTIDQAAVQAVGNNNSVMDADELVAIINAQTTGLTAANNAGTITLTSGTTGTSSSVAISNTATSDVNASGFTNTSGVVDGAGTAGQAAGAAKTLSFDVAVDGGAATTVTINLAAVQAVGDNDGIIDSVSELATIVDAQLGAGVTVDGSGATLVLSSATTGSSSSITISNTTPTNITNTSGVANGTDAGAAAVTASSISFSLAVDGGAATTITLDAAAVTSYNSANSTSLNASALTANDVRDLINDQAGANIASVVSGALTFTSTTTGTSSNVTISGYTASVAGGSTGIANGTDSGAAAVTGSADSFTINGRTVTLAGGDDASDILTAIQNAASGSTGTDAFTVSNSSGVLTITGTAGNDVVIAGLSTEAATALGLQNGTTDGTPAAAASPNPKRAELVETYNALLGQIDALAADSGFNGVNLLNGDDLSVLFNEDGSSSLAIEGVTNNAAGLGLAALGSTAFDTNSSINSTLDDLKASIDTLRSQSAKFGSNLSVVETRQDFTKNMINVLQTGAANLTLADTNEEAANVLALQTRQQLSSTALSLASQADQNVLRLF